MEITVEFDLFLLFCVIFRLRSKEGSEGDGEEKSGLRRRRRLRRRRLLQRRRLPWWWGDRRRWSSTSSASWRGSINSQRRSTNFICCSLGSAGSWADDLQDLTAEFEDRLISIHKEQMEKWQEEIKELRAQDASNEASRSLLQNAQFHLLQNVDNSS
uniref:Uncharacterized protein n=1 Tax=Ananas comosus var. bracteatus TaxID=296719 RepID=A0A6V7NE02_ANACO|nr:unnamed protein product [Ananas comosus var. bracteatus]